jgi:predicted unusual protein kinase regulating ubiquinone biosynthesis (AarF/ABC1/UbiB family)
MISNILFVFKTFLIIGYNWLIYYFTNDYNTFIINIAEQLTRENIFYGKMFQAISSNTTLTDDYLSKYLLKYNNNVDWDEEDIDYEAIHKLKYYNNEKKYSMINLKYFRPVNAGLISLIYHANLNGEVVIIKIKRKNIIKKFNEAFDNLSFLIKFINHIKYINGFNIHRIFYDNKKLLLEQLDFTNEVNNIKLFERKYKNIDYIVVPKVYEEFTNMNENVIVMEYIKGKNILEITSDEKKIYSKLFINFGLKSFLFDGVYHADTHPGNIIFIRDSLNDTYKLGIIDYGIVGKLTREEQNLFYLFISNLFLKNYEECIQHMFELMTEPCNSNNSNNSNKYLIENYKNDKTIINTMREILINVNEINKKFTINDLIQLNNLLNKYDIQLRYNFSNVQLAMAVCESTHEALCIHKTFIECFQDEAEKLNNLFEYL